MSSPNASAQDDSSFRGAPTVNDVQLPDRRLMLPCMKGLSMIAACAASMLASPVFAQSSAPVTSSVFVHPATEDTGGQSAAINDNWKFITNPPAHPVAASEPASSSGAHQGRHGRGGGAGGGGRMGNTGGMAAAPTDPSTNPPLAPPAPLTPASTGQ
jgi:hypothetical protein